MRSMTLGLIIGCVLPMLSAGCSKPAAANWVAITQGDPCASQAAPAPDSPPGVCDAPSFYLDTANISFTGGTPYVILQTRYADGRVGKIRAEANCPRRKLEPTALQEDVFGSDGARLTNRMITMSGADEKAVLDRACAKA